MDKDRFTANLLAATAALLPFMRKLVVNELPDECRYLFPVSREYYARLMVSGSPHLGTAFPQPIDSVSLWATDAGLVRVLSADDAVELLWDSETIPRWVNIEVHSADRNYTYIKLECGRWVAADAEDQLYHHDEGYPPFHVLSGFLPAGWESVERDGKFDLHDTRR